MVRHCCLCRVLQLSSEAMHFTLPFIPFSCKTLEYKIFSVSFSFLIRMSEKHPLRRTFCRFSTSLLNLFPCDLQSLHIFPFCFQLCLHQTEKPTSIFFGGSTTRNIRRSLQIPTLSKDRRQSPACAGSTWNSTSKPRTKIPTFVSFPCLIFITLTGTVKHF